MTRNDERLQRAVNARLEPGETMLASTRAWVSRERRLQFLLGSRHRDFAVVTDRRLLLWSAGFFTRRPRRRVLAERLDELLVASVGRDPGRRISCRRAGRRALLLELGRNARADKFALELLDRAQDAGAPATTPPVPPPFVPRSPGSATTPPAPPAASPPPAAPAPPAPDAGSPGVPWPS